MKFSEKLKQIRKENNLTQDEMADKIFVTRAAISKWENDLSYPSIESLKIISKTFNVSLDELFSDEDLVLSNKVSEKFNRKMYALSMIFLAVTASLVYLEYIFQNKIFYLFSIISMICYFYFAISASPRWRKIENRKMLFKVILSRILLFAMLIALMISNFV